MLDEITFRPAEQTDVPTIVQMLADDPLGQQREQYGDPLPTSYYEAFTAITADPNNELVVACIGKQVVGVFQLTFIPNMSYRGSWRALIEGVRVAAAFRSRGIGGVLLAWAIDRAKQRGCHMLQLTTNKSRLDAHRFYENLGFEASHVGMKLLLS